VDTPAYAYLLGLYLGDGHIVSKRQQHHLSIYCCDGWPGLIDAAERAMRTVIPSATVSRRQRPGCQEVKSYSIHWPCLFPQHGPGRKHERGIALVEWQQTIVERHPGLFLRGLFHSDGWRGVNRVRRELPGGERWYEYPRYLFSNRSKDILELCAGTLDLIGVEWKYNNWYSISVAKAKSVAALDRHIGPKY